MEMPRDVQIRFIAWLQQLVRPLADNYPVSLTAGDLRILLSAVGQQAPPTSNQQQGSDLRELSHARSEPQDE